MARNLRKITERREGRWWYQRWNDGTEQWSIYTQGKRACLYVERVNRKKSRRVNWCVVNRCTEKESAFPGVFEMDTGKYPPKVAGPFDDLPGAKTALLVLLTT